MCLCVFYIEINSPQTLSILFQSIFLRHLCFRVKVTLYCLYIGPTSVCQRVFSYKQREITGKQFLDFQEQKMNAEDPNEVYIDLAEHEIKGKDRKWSEEGSCSELCRLWLNCYWALEQAAQRGWGISILGGGTVWLGTALTSRAQLVLLWARRVG